jgi:phospholipid/cholesterol/gamma-HCH transport system substrate-binding protein
MSDRNLGYSIIFFLLIFILIPTGYLSVQHLAPAHYRTIVFTSVNTLSFLKQQDPVRIRGIQVGQVRTISWSEGKTCVVIETRQKLSIHPGYRIIAETKGFMGDRYLDINPGDTNASLIDAKDSLAGVFPMGPTEALAYMGELRGKVHSLVKLTNELRCGSAGKKPFPEHFNSIVREFDSISASLTHILHSIDRLVCQNADTLAVVLKNSRDFSERLNTGVPEAAAKIDSVITKTKKLLVMMDSLGAAAGPLADRLDAKEARALADLFRQLRRRAESLRNIINEIREDGVKVRIRL